MLSRQKLWTEDELRLEKAVKICRAAERAEKQIHELQSDSSSLAVNALSASNKSYDCKRCGRNHLPRSCPAFNKICTACGRKGHFRACCFGSNNSKEKKPQSYQRKTSKKIDTMKREESDTEEDTDGEYQINGIKLYEERQYRVNFIGKDDEKWSAKMSVKGAILKVKLDSGAECNVLSLKEAKRLKAKLRASRTKRLIAYNNEKINVLGEVRVLCRNKKHEREIIFKVVEEDLKPILGRRMCEKMGFIQSPKR